MTTSSPHHPPPSHSSFSVHQSLGGGSLADLLLWRNPSNSRLLLIGSTSIWFVFQRAGYSLLSTFSNSLLLLVSILFFWAKSATLLNRPPPPLPSLELTNAFIEKVAESSVLKIKHLLQLTHDIIFKGDVNLFLKVASGLLLFSYIESSFNLFTIVYITIVVSLTIPVLYENLQDDVDKILSLAHRFLLQYFKRIDDILHKVEVPEGKKVQ